MSACFYRFYRSPTFIPGSQQGAIHQGEILGFHGRNYCDHILADKLLKYWSFYHCLARPKYQHCSLLLPNSTQHARKTIYVAHFNHKIIRCFIAPSPILSGIHLLSQTNLEKGDDIRTCMMKRVQQHGAKGLGTSFVVHKIGYMCRIFCFVSPALW